MNTKEKKNVILRFLYDRKESGSYIDLKDLSRSNPQISWVDIEQVAEFFSSEGYIKKSSTKESVNAIITLEGIEYVEKLYEYQPSDRIDSLEQEILADKVDELLERLKKVELGQQVIYDDLVDELQELKKLLSVLGKKDWKQILQGKLVDAGLGSIASEVMKAMAETFSKQNLLH